MSGLRFLAPLSGVIGLLAASPALASSGMTPLWIFANAAVLIKLMILALIALMAGALAVAVRKVTAPQIGGGSAFIAALRLGGPLVGLLGAALNALWILVGITAAGRDIPLAVLAPGLAEAALVLSLGLVAGVVAVVCHWAVEARIDRAVLRG